MTNDERALKLLAALREIDDLVDPLRLHGGAPTETTLGELWELVPCHLIPPSVEADPFEFVATSVGTE